MDESLRVFFLHVTKCGGTSIKAALRASVPKIGEHDMIVDLDAAAATSQAKTLGRHTLDYRDELLCYMLAARDTRVVMGHFRFTEHLHDRFRESWKFITVLREPEERFLSMYFYDKYKRESYARIDDSLHDYLFNTPRRAQVHAERFVSMFRGDGRPPTELSTQADVDAATRHLERFHFVGFLTDLAPMRDTLSEWTDTNVQIPILNRTPAPASSREEVDEKAMERVREICAPARQVYDRIWDQRESYLEDLEDLE